MTERQQDVTRRMQRETVNQGQQALERTIDLQRDATKMMLSALEWQETAQRQGLELTKSMFRNYLEGVEAVVPEMEDAMDRGMRELESGRERRSRSDGETQRTSPRVEPGRRFEQRSQQGFGSGSQQGFESQPRQERQYAQPPAEQPSGERPPGGAVDAERQFGAVDTERQFGTGSHSQGTSSGRTPRETGRWIQQSGPGHEGGRYEEGWTGGEPPTRATDEPGARRGREERGWEEAAQGSPAPQGEEGYAQPTTGSGMESEPGRRPEETAERRSQPNREESGRREGRTADENRRPQESR